MRINLEQAISKIQLGEVVAIPTETVYGLAASLALPEAIQLIFDLKKRPLNNPLIIHVCSTSQIKEYTSELPPDFDRLADFFWPGPLTMIIPIQCHLVPQIVRANLCTAGFRIPQHPLAQQLMHFTGPLVMPSANLSGKPSATSAAHVEEDFGSQFPVLDGGRCKRGLESTIIGWKNGKWNIFRLGALSASDFESVIGYRPLLETYVNEDQPSCPGQLFRHYSPKAKLILGDSAKIEESACILGFREREYLEGKRLFILGSLKDAEEVAENLYYQLRRLDEENISVAWVDMDFPCEGLWITIAERLTRAGQ